MSKLNILSELELYSIDAKELTLFFIIKKIKKEMSCHSTLEDECDVIKNHINKAIISDDTKNFVLSKIREYKIDELILR